MKSTTSLAIGAVVALLLFNAPLHAQEKPAAGHYLYAWAGDIAGKGTDFLAVIDADPASSTYGHLITTVATDQKSMQVHHTEYTMPDSGFLFANDHLAGRTFIVDLNDPRHPTITVR